MLQAQAEGQLRLRTAENEAYAALLAQALKEVGPQGHDSSIHWPHMQLIIFHGPGANQADIRAPKE